MFWNLQVGYFYAIKTIYDVMKYLFNKANKSNYNSTPCSIGLSNLLNPIKDHNLVNAANCS